MAKQLEFGVVANPESYDIETAFKITIEGAKFTETSFKKALHAFNIKYSSGEISSEQFPDNVTIANIIPLRDGKLYVQKERTDTGSKDITTTTEKRRSKKISAPVDELDDSELVIAAKHVTEVAEVYSERQTLLVRSQPEFDICKVVDSLRMLTTEQIELVGSEGFGKDIVAAARASAKLQTLREKHPLAMAKVSEMYAAAPAQSSFANSSNGDSDASLLDTSPTSIETNGNGNGKNGSKKLAVA